MSTVTTPRRNNTTQKDADSKRMPFEAAEALLWGKATYQQHEALYRRMKDLEEAHSAYDTRIQAAKSITEAAEAASSRVRQIEQRIVAIEEDERDKRFNNCVTAELDGLKIFVEKNRGLRQRQIELEKRFSDATDGIELARDVSKQIHALTQQVSNLEAKRTADIGRIKELERDVTSLTLMRNNYLVENANLHAQLDRSETNPRMKPPQAKQPDPMSSDPAEETEDEDMFTSPIINPNGFDLSSPIRFDEAGKNSSTAAPTSPSRTHENMSARLRMMQRNSIHEPRKGGEIEPTQIVKQVIPSVEHSLRWQHKNNELPPTQLVDQSDTTAKARATEQRKADAKPVTASQLAVKLPISLKKRKREVESCSPRLTRSQAQAKSGEQSEVKKAAIQRRRNVKGGSKVDETTLVHATASPKTGGPVETQIIDNEAPKRRKVEMQKKSMKNSAQVQEKEVVEPTQLVSKVAKSRFSATEVVKPDTKRRSCNACFKARSKCDNARPTCGTCRRLPNRGPCVYVTPAVVAAQCTSTASRPTAQRSAKSSVAATTSKPTTRTHNPQDSLVPAPKSKGSRKHGKR